DNLHAWWWIHGTYPGAEINLNNFNCLTTPLPFTDAMPLHDGGYYIPVIDAMDDARNDAIALLENVCIDPTDLTAALTELQGAYADLKDAILEYVAELRGTPEFNFSFRDVADRTTPVPNRDLAENEEFIVRYDLSNNEGLCDLYTTITVAVTGPTGADITFDLISSSTGAFIADLMIDRHEIGSGQLNSAMPGGMIAGAFQKFSADLAGDYKIVYTLWDVKTHTGAPGGYPSSTATVLAMDSVILTVVDTATFTITIAGNLEFHASPALIATMPSGQAYLNSAVDAEIARLDIQPMIINIKGNNDGAVGRNDVRIIKTDGIHYNLQLWANDGTNWYDLSRAGWLPNGNEFAVTPDHDEDIEVFVISNMTGSYPSAYDLYSALGGVLDAATDTIVVYNYRVTFNSNGGSFVPEQHLNNGDKVAKPADPIRTGYTFDGWYTDDEDFTNAWDFATYVITSDTTLYAKWETDSFDIHYTLLGGTNHIDNPAKYTTECPNITLEPATRKGYTFINWYPSNSIPTGSTGDKWFTASWSIINYNITYVLNGGTNNPNNPATYTIESPTITLQDPTRPGYDFVSWTPSSTIPAGDTGHVTFTANWSAPITYNITYVLDGGTNHTSNPANYTVESATITLQDPIRTGHTFTGWTPSNNIPAGSTGDRTFTANWDVHIHVVAFESQGGTAVAPQNVAHGQKVVRPTDPTRLGYTFDGWFKEAGCVNVWDFAVDVVTTATTLYAKWNTITYNISFVMNGGTYTGTQPTTYTVESSLITLTTPTRPGYTFTGWTPNNNIPAGSTGDRTFTANWSAAINYNITYVLNGGTNHAGNPATYTVESPTITLQAPTREGYNFVNWTPSSTITAGSTGNLTFTANWSAAINYNITYVLNGGTNHASNPLTYNVATPTITLQDPTRTGYTFTGWTPSNTIPTGSTGDRTFTAHWNINTYTVTFNSQGGSPVTSQTINYGGTVAVPATPTLMGHIFDGWYREAAGVNAWNFATDVVTSNLTLYAKWTADDKHTVIVVANNGNLGTASGGATDVIEGTQLTLTAAPRTGFVLINWTIDGVVVSTDESFIYTVTSAITTTITANFGMLFEDYVVMRWGSTFMLNITAKTGVGITTVNSCQWYLGSTLLTTTYGPNYGYTAGSAANTLQPNGQYRYVIQTNMGEIPSTIFQGYTPQKSTPLTGYPNPIFSGERLTVEGVTEGSQIEVYNQRGVRVISTKATGTQTTININLPAGQYLLRTENGTMNVIVNK
ncbi:MAG: InlB B-repeat-containing protein, partial [Bacteroidales bacterium]|nr:InlB B-repeat-containing protein [Bacteroidales bacterium]